jgi:hypothetical protein
MMPFCTTRSACCADAFAIGMQQANTAPASEYTIL